MVNNKVVVEGAAVEDSAGRTVESEAPVEVSAGWAVEFNCNANAFAGVETSISSLLSRMFSVVRPDAESTGGDNSVSERRFVVEGESNLSTSADATSSATSPVLSIICRLLLSEKMVIPFGWYIGSLSFASSGIGIISSDSPGSSTFDARGCSFNSSFSAQGSKTCSLFSPSVT